TAARFAPADNGRSYKTGDRVRSVDGRLFFLERLDRQVKIRGRRVEPGELEAVLLKQPGVRDAAVRVEIGRDGLQTLAAFVETSGGTEPALLKRLRAV